MPITKIGRSVGPPAPDFQEAQVVVRALDDYLSLCHDIADETDWDEDAKGGEGDWRPGSDGAIATHYRARCQQWIDQVAAERTADYD